MPRNYKRTTTRQSWSEVDMETAIKLVLDGAMGYSKASKIHNVPQSTLQARVKKARKGTLVENASKKGSYNQNYFNLFDLTIIKKRITLIQCWEKYFPRVSGYRHKMEIKAFEKHRISDTLIKILPNTAQVMLFVKQNKKTCFHSLAYMGGFRTVFTSDQEQELADYISIMESRLFDLTMLELRTMAYDLAVENGVGNKFDVKKKMAGEDWLRGFLKRHTELSLKIREKSSPAATGFDRERISEFFHILQGLIEKYKFSPVDIYNVAEAGITTVSDKPSTIIAIRGGKKIGTLDSADRGESLVTTEICMSAAGIFMPTMFIFPSKKEDPTLLADALPGSTAEYNETGSIEKDQFVSWFKRFISFANPSIKKPVLLLLDGQASHNKSFEVIQLARERSVILLSFPPNCVDKMQPLDVTLMPSLSACYEQEVKKWLSAHPGTHVTIRQVGKLFGSAFMIAAVMGIAINGFKKTGIYPFDPNIFPDNLFPQSDSNDRSLRANNDSMENLTDADDPPASWFPENSVGNTNFGILGSQPSTSTSREICFGTQSKNLVNEIHSQGTQVATKNDRIIDENILVCSPYKFELENALANVTQQQTGIFKRKRSDLDIHPGDTRKFQKKQQQEYNDTVRESINDNSSSGEEIHL